ncbi:FAD dependent oxidoreductase [Desarmillaria tabescens]|uniref:FAD dependent oxidoreductase n=1 Tax=Armillaria tabescens TaxID=1929756 RepID=A0AA39N8H0_ARMTA|nr:FAD dependent oxidoreductase [Desarmillaria tabescens]XP_060332867.1 FAD dependent oxidoreductase [Desarmillaria tabescens]KAK0460967.1 FAD dependent oxidoreductase [Desarmillaria tabescens]KAK0460970.1 FAD dependent oxidoreductase [Desarmillaria tabescens]
MSSLYTTPVLGLSKGLLVLDTSANATGAPRNRQRVLVVGGGVTGLTTAWILLDAGYDVTVVSEQWAPATPRITSQIAGALWEYPPAVCGQHTDAKSLALSKGWSLTSYRIFDQLSKSLPAIKMRTANFFFGKAIEDLPDQLSKMREIEASCIKGFVRDPDLIAKHAVNQNAGVVDAYSHLAPVWLHDLVEAKGAELITRRIDGDLLDSEAKLLETYGAVAIVNATGLNSFESAGDKSCYPLRGGLIRLVNDGKRFPKVTEALAVMHDNELSSEHEDIVFIVPRNDNILILGGIAQPHRWELNLTMESPEIQRMRERCNKFVPGLENAEFDPVAPVVQGLRPTRVGNVRVERELRPNRMRGGSSSIVHSYGQGGSGFSFSVGCAVDVLHLIDQVVLERRVGNFNVEMYRANL